MKQVNPNIIKFMLNHYPPYRASGARVMRISPDVREVDIRLALNWRTRNLVGTMFGGSMYTATDPIYMLMLIHNMGPDYVVWDKAAKIKFIRPGKTSLDMKFRLDQQEIDEITELLKTKKHIDRKYEIELLDKNGEVCAIVEKLIYIARQKPDKRQKVRSLFARFM